MLHCFFPNTKCCTHFENQRILKDRLCLSVSRMKVIVFKAFKQLSTSFELRFFQLWWKDCVLRQMNPIHILTQIFFSSVSVSTTYLLPILVINLNLCLIFYTKTVSANAFHFICKLLLKSRCRLVQLCTY